MIPLTYSWIGQCAAAPVVFLSSAWVLGVFHSYRRHWLSVDLFLLAVAVQELLMALQVFVFSLLNLVKPEWDGACGALVWSLNATRALQLATVTSLLADRALTCHWPYRYRFSVRRHQLRYHLAVLAAMAALLGVAALIARPQHPPSFPHCAAMPHLLHVRLALFLLAVYAALLLLGCISATVVQTSRGCTYPDPPDLTPITNTTSSTASSNRHPLSTTTSSNSSHGRQLHTSASTASSTSSTRLGIGGSGGGGLHASTADLLPHPPAPPTRPSVLRSTSSSSPGGTDFRWGTCISVAFLCCGVNHIPYLSLIVVGTFMPSYLPSWPSDNLALWLSVAEGVLFPLLLLAADATFRRAAIATCCCSSGAAARAQKTKARNFKDIDGPFRLFPKEDVKAFPLTNGSLFSSLLTLPMDGHPTNPYHVYKKDPNIGLRMGIAPNGLRCLDIRKLAAGRPCSLQRATYGSPYYSRDPAESLASGGNTSQDPLYSDPTMKASSMDSSLKEDHIYATLSETFGSMSSFSDAYMNDENRCSSVTTVANDDFEFHDPRVSGCNINDHQLGSRNPCMRHQSCSGSSFSSAAGLATYDLRSREDTLVMSSVCNHNIVNNHNVVVRPPANLPPEAYPPHHIVNADPKNVALYRINNTDLVMEKNRQNMMNCIKEEPVPVQRSHKIEYDNLVFESDTLEKKHYMEKYQHENVMQIKNEEECYNQRNITNKEDASDGTLSRKHRTSSLSMNDLDRFEKESNSGPEEEMMFLLPVKSESMLTLYRLYLAEDEQDSGTSLHYSFELSKSENDLSVVTEERESIGRSTEDVQPISHEIYQKRRRPQSSASKIRRQHKIQRAKGLHLKNKPQYQQNKTLTNTQSPQTKTKPNTPVAITKVIDDNDYGVQVAIMDKSRRQNGIITIRDPSGLSVQELFSVLNRAACNGGRMRMDNPQPTVGNSSVTTIPIRDQRHHTTAPEGTHTEFKKIFVSEYL